MLQHLDFFLFVNSFFFPYWAKKFFFFFSIVDFPRLYARRCDTDLRFCQLNPLTGEATPDEHHQIITPSTLKRRFINALLIYNRYTTAIPHEAPAAMDLVQHHLLVQCIPSLSAKEISPLDVENAFWLINEYKKTGHNFISLHQFFGFIDNLSANKIICLRETMSWAKLTPVLIRAIVQSVREYDTYVKNCFRQILAYGEQKPHEQD